MVLWRGFPFSAEDTEAQRAQRIYCETQRRKGREKGSSHEEHEGARRARRILVGIGEGAPAVLEVAMSLGGIVPSSRCPLVVLTG